MGKKGEWIFSHSMFLTLVVFFGVGLGVYAVEMSKMAEMCASYSYSNGVIQTSEIVRLSKVTIRSEMIQPYLAAVAECGRISMARESGVRMMYSMQSKQSLNCVTILEIYQDQEAYDRHIQTPHFLRYKQDTLQMIQKLELLDQNPLVPEMRMKGNS